MSMPCSAGSHRNALGRCLLAGACFALLHRFDSLFPELGRAPRPRAGRPVEQWKAVRPYRSDKLLDSFTMQREIQPVALDFLGHAQADRKVDDLDEIGRGK